MAVEVLPRDVGLALQEGKIPRDNRAGLWEVLGTAGSACVGTPVARRSHAHGLMRGVALRVLAAIADGSRGVEAVGNRASCHRLL